MAAKTASTKNHTKTPHLTPQEIPISLRTATQPNKCGALSNLMKWTPLWKADLSGGISSHWLEQSQVAIFHPKNLVPEILEEIHEDILARHNGLYKTK
jgi:hypothetical protein